MKTIGYALVGLGKLSIEQIAPAFRQAKRCRLTGIVTGRPAEAAKIAASFNIPPSSVYSYETFDQIADNPDIDIVFIVLPNSMHHEFTIRAAKAGKHVLCEKPMANTVQECEEMIAACRQANRQLAIAYRCQFEPHHLECIRLAREKVFGNVKVIEAGFGFRLGDDDQWRLRKPLAGGGALMDVGIYALQACRYLTGEEPVMVSGMETKTNFVKFKEVDETITWQMIFPSGIVANCSTTYGLDGIDHFRVFAEKGWFELAPAYSFTGLQGRRSDGREIRFPQIDHFAAEKDDLADCVMNDRPSKVPGEEGLRDLKVIEAIYRSIAEGRTVRLS